MEVSGPFMLEPGRELRVPVAGNRGIPATARAASLNIIAAGAWAPGYLVAVPCGQSSDVSNVNFNGDGGAVANGANVKLDGSGAVCVTTSAPVHVIIDITGVWR
jgi:hypothetical protein